MPMALVDKDLTIGWAWRKLNIWPIRDRANFASTSMTVAGDTVMRNITISLLEKPTPSMNFFLAYTELVMLVGLNEVVTSDIRGRKGNEETGMGGDRGGVQALF